MRQFGLFEERPAPRTRDYGLRWYQREAKDAAEDKLLFHRSILLVLATGLGKTRLAGAIIGDWDGAVLFLAHRDELITQAVKAIESITGEACEVEQAELRASEHCRIVVGSVQSVMRDKRLERLQRHRFSLIVIDEAHHAPAASYRKILDAFPDAKVIGITATPDRGDGVAMGNVFETVAYQRDIAEGIDDGYLVPIRGVRVRLEKVDISSVETQGGDLHVGQLDSVMFKATEGVVKETLRLAGERRGILFFPGVRSADLATHRLNTLKPGCAALVHAGTKDEERRDIMEGLRGGSIQFLCNVGIATEGFDWPEASYVGLARPTKSRSLYAQMVGRGGRPGPDAANGPTDVFESAARRELIRTSSKPDTIVADLVGNSGRHVLVSPVDLLGGKFTDSEVKRAKELEAELPDGAEADPKELLERARVDLAAISKRVRSVVRAQVADFNPFAMLGMDRDKEFDEAFKFGAKPISAAQKGLLKKAGIDERDLQGMPAHAAQRLVQTIMVRRQRNLASLQQLRTLRRYVAAPLNISSDRASAAIDYIAQGGWKVRNTQELERILGMRRKDVGP